MTRVSHAWEIASYDLHVSAPPARVAKAIVARSACYSNAKSPIREIKIKTIAAFRILCYPCNTVRCVAQRLIFDKLTNDAMQNDECGMNISYFFLPAAALRTTLFAKCSEHEAYGNAQAKKSFFIFFADFRENVSVNNLNAEG